MEAKQLLHILELTVGLTACALAAMTAFVGVKYREKIERAEKRRAIELFAPKAKKDSAESHAHEVLPSG